MQIIFQLDISFLQITTFNEVGIRINKIFFLRIDRS